MMGTDLAGASICNPKQDQELLKSAKDKLEEVIEENERLKKLLAQILKDYECLKKKIFLMAQSKQLLSHKSSNNNNSNNNNRKDNINDDNQDLVSLTLGSWSTSTIKQDSDHGALNKRRKINGGLKLGLDYGKFEPYSTASASASVNSESMKNSTLDGGKGESSEEKNIKARESKISFGKLGDGGCSVQLEAQVKKTRVCIKSRCETAMMNDGCQWRKYGQKIAKGNPCPRAYYRCTLSSSCPVRKQVQRCVHDMSILITTYEGTHNHQLPLAATTRASATTAAAAMVKTGPIGFTNHQTTTTCSSFGLYNSSNLINPFQTNPRLSFVNPSLISASHHSHPTINLDLTSSTSSSVATASYCVSTSSSSFSSSKKTSSFLNFSSSPWASGQFNDGVLFPYSWKNPTSIHQNPSDSQALDP